MKLIIVRHGDPNYAIDSLTDAGWIEAELLSERLKSMDVTAFYSSPQGRAVATSRATLEKTGREAEILPWLCEFKGHLQKPNEDRPGCAWNWRPDTWVNEPAFYHPELWHTVPPIAGSNVKKLYDGVTTEFDLLLARHGYRRSGAIYKAEHSNEDTLVFFCHFGVECVMLSHLLHVSPMILWNHLCALPTSVTTVVTEERLEGEAVFRMLSFGDTSHLYVANREPSFAGRYGETFAQNKSLGLN